ncbi:MAG: photosynthetic protein synthase [Bacteroidetes bacterium]|nr:photosynthetic protein synthase [Bacteroidota bacterium]
MRFPYFVRDLPVFLQHKIQNKLKKGTVLIILLFILTFPSVLYVILATGETNFIRLPYIGERELAANGKDTIYHSVQPFSFINQDGKTITDKDYDGKIYVADYFFTTCQTICPKMATELLRVQEKFAYTNGLVQILSHTVNPENDSVPVLKSYSEMIHADNSMWNFVTGDKKQLYDMARYSYLVNAMEGNGGPDDFIHSELFVLVDKEKHIRGIYDGTDIKAVNDLLDDIKVLIAEYAIKETKDKEELE